MQETNRTRVQISAKPTKVVPTEAVLVPPMINGSNVPSKDKQKRRQGTQVIDPHPLLQLHPLFNFCRVIPLPPPLQIDDHDPRVEVARPPIRERERQRRVGPERWGEVRGEIGVAVFGGSQDLVFAQWCCCQLGNVVDEDEIGVQVHHAPHADGQEVGQVGARVV